MKTITKYLTVLLFLFALSLTAQQKDFTKEPGYVDFGELAEFETGEAVTEVYIDETLLQMVAKMTKEKEPEMADLLNGLKLVKVNSYEISDENETEILNRMESIAQKLNGTKWQKMVRRKAKDETVYVFVRTGNTEKFTGLVVLAFDKPGEAAFINIVGDIDLASIGKLSNKFDIPALNKMNETEEKDSLNE
ncbi:MAG: DUF4252 domain-containing protein [Melioribacteraceae bacterium]|nr:DUF4252 domain-containing protein [Melioribacteraceae bacterium]